MTHLAEVIPLYGTNAADVSAMLRAFADQVDAGEFGDSVRAVTVFDCSGKIEVRGWGKIEGLEAIAYLNLGLASMVNGTLGAMSE